MAGPADNLPPPVLAALLQGLEGELVELLRRGDTSPGGVREAELRSALAAVRRQIADMGTMN